jgi:hypothetical protein
LLLAPSALSSNFFIVTRCVAGATYLLGLPCDFYSVQGVKMHISMHMPLPSF